jgi:hypothetical protein
MLPGMLASPKGLVRSRVDRCRPWFKIESKMLGLPDHYEEPHCQFGDGDNPDNAQ